MVPPPPELPKWSFRGGGRARGGGGGGTAKVARKPPGESSQMRAGGATEAIWDDSARRLRGFARGCGHERVPLMYSTAAPGEAERPKCVPQGVICWPKLAAWGVPRERRPCVPNTTILRNKKNPDIPGCSNFAMTPLFGQKIFYVHKSTTWSTTSRRLRLDPRMYKI